MKRRTLLVGGTASLVAGAAGVTLLSKRESEGTVAPPEDRLVGGVPARPSKAPAVRPTPPRDRPNVLMIAIDDMKPWVGPYGFTDAHTPSMDALDKTGMIFTRAYCAAPACSPSRAAVLTGVAPHETGCYFNRQNWHDHKPELTTLPRLYRDTGYITAGFGKLFHSKFHDDRNAWDERQHHHLMRQPKGAPLNVPASIYRKAGSRFDWAAVDVPVEAMDDHKQVDRTIDAMKRFGSRPWFIACGLFRPHLPWYVPRRFYDLHPLNSIKIPETLPGDLDDVPKVGRKMARQEEHRVLVSRGLWRPAVQAYMASISYADYELGRLLNAVSKDTVVLIWSDHGWHLGPKNHWHKYALWEEASRTVFAMQGPDILAGKHCERVVSLNDIYPTLCEVSGLRAPHPLSGRSVMPLTSKPGRTWAHEALTTYGANNHSLRNERYRYIHYEDGGEELYDHESDPNEWHNLALKREYEAVLAGFRKHLPQRNAHLQRCQDKAEHPSRSQPKGAPSEGKKRRRGRKGKKPHASAEWTEVDGRRMLLPV